MPPLETVVLHQEAALWAFSGHDADGNPKVSAPVEIACNWVDRRSMLVGPDGDQVSIDSSAMVDRYIAEGSVLRLGKLESVPDPPDELVEVVGRGRIPDIKNQERVYTVNMRRITKLPTIV